MIDYIIVGVVIAALALVIIRARVRKKAGGGGCAGCTACAQSDKTQQQDCGCKNHNQ